MTQFVMKWIFKAIRMIDSIERSDAWTLLSFKDFDGADKILKSPFGEISALIASLYSIDYTRWANCDILSLQTILAITIKR